MQTNIEERVKAIIVEYAVGFELCDIKNDSSLNSDLGLDSLDHIDILMAGEDEFGIEISDEDAEKIATVQQAIDYVTAKVAA